MQDRGTPDVGDVVGEKYRIESILGQGGMGTVFAARHTLTDRKVALKWMLPDFKNDPLSGERFLREARAMGRIDHPRVVSVLDVGQDGPATFIVMERLRGESLRARMASEGTLSPRDAIRLLMPALEGLAAAHALGIVHRDLKPENLYLVRDGDSESTKVLDFGISKFQSEPGDAASPMTQSGVTMGTPSYMSPEQVRGLREVDARTDVWAVGVILHEMLMGTPPFRAESYGALLVAIATEAPTPLSDAFPEALRDVVARTLDKDPEQRFASVDALAEALLPFADGELTFRAAPAESIAPPPPTPRPATALTSSPTRQALPAHLAATRAAEPSHRSSRDVGEPTPPTSIRSSEPERASLPEAAPPASRGVWPVLGVLAAIAAVSAAAWMVTVGPAETAADHEVEPPSTVGSAPAASPPIEAPAEPVAVPAEPIEGALPAVEVEADSVEPLIEVPPPSAEPAETHRASTRRERRRPHEDHAAPEEEVRGRSGSLSRDDF